MTNNTVTTFVSGARNFATGVKNWLQKPMAVFWYQFWVLVTRACVIGISRYKQNLQAEAFYGNLM